LICVLREPSRPQAQLALLVLEAGAHPPGPFGAEVPGGLPRPLEGGGGGGERPLELAQDPWAPCDDRAPGAQGIRARAPDPAGPPAPRPPRPCRPLLSPLP